MTTRASLEATAVVLTAALHFVFYHLLSCRGPFIVATVVVWAAYFVIRVRGDAGALRAFGLSTHGLRESGRATGLVFLVGAAVCLIGGLWRGQVRFVPHMLVLALLYPVWGLVQQLLVQAMVVRNLIRVLPLPVLVAVAAVLFGLVHLPELPLAVATALLGGAFTLIFVRWRNVWPLGICHGLLGVLFYYWVLGRDPWLEIVR